MVKQWLRKHGFSAAVLGLAAVLLTVLLCCAHNSQQEPVASVFSAGGDASLTVEGTKEENLFAMEVVPTPSPDAPTVQETPAAPAQNGGAFRIEVVRNGQGQQPAKRVLIYHTHTYEAYEQSEKEPYKETERWRTTDNQHNMVRVGEELAALLRAVGVEVVHDVTAFEPPDLSSAYVRSLGMLEQRKANGEAYDLYIDLHRDAYSASQTGSNCVQVGETAVARLMMLIGKGDGQTTEGFEHRPDWEKNFAIAKRITEQLNAQLPGLGKEVRTKSGRFNQHIAVGCVLVEAGNNKNTLEEVLQAMPYLADAIEAALSE